MFHQVHVQQGHPRLQRGHHAGAIQLHEDVVLEVHLHVQVEHRVERVDKPVASQVLRYQVGRLGIIERGFHLGRQELGPLLPGERPEPAGMTLAYRVAGPVDKALQLEVEADVVHRDRQPSNQGRHQAVAQHGGHPLVVGGQAMSQERRIPGKQLIATVAAQGDRDRLPGEARQQVGGHDRGIGKRLIHHLRDRRNEIGEHARLEDHFVMIGSQMRGHLAGISRLVEGAVGKADGKTVDLAR